MKRSLLLLGLGVSLLGAGCVSNLFRTPSQPIRPMPVPIRPQLPPTRPPVQAVTTTPAIPPGWTGFSERSPSFSFSYPPYASRLSDDQRAPEDVIVLDLGSMAATTTQTDVPTTKLSVKVLSATDKDIKDCMYSNSGWPDGYTPDIAKHVMLNGTDFCLTSEGDAAAGNRYNSYNYATKNGDSVIVFNFVVHSSSCQNYDNPQAQCVEFDEARDTKFFKDIVQTYTTEPQAVTDGTPYFTNQIVSVSTTEVQVHVVYPHLGGIAAAATFDPIIDKLVLAGVDQFKQDTAGADPSMSSGFPLTYTMDYQVYRHNDHQFSIIESGEEYTGGAHGNSIYHAITYDTQANKELKLADLFAPKTPFLDEISAAALRELTKRNAISQYSDANWLKTGTAPDASNFQFFYVTNDSLGIIFPPYQVAAYAAGEQDIEIPLASLKGVLKD